MTETTYKGYRIIESEWVVEDGRRSGASAIFLIAGLKEKPLPPYLFTVEDAKSYIDMALDGSGATATFEARISPRGNSLGVVIPAADLHRLGLERGDRVRVTIHKDTQRSRDLEQTRTV